MFFKMHGNVHYDGTMAVKGTLVRDIDLPDHADILASIPAVEQFEDDVALLMIAKGEIGHTIFPHSDPVEIPMLEEIAEDDVVDPFAAILNNNLTNATALIEEIESIDFLTELREAEVNLDNRKGIHRAIDDQIALCEPATEPTEDDPTPPAEGLAVHAIADTETM